jgi:hypothetical protein
MMEAVRTSETSVDNHFTRQYIPEDNSEHQYLSGSLCWTYFHLALNPRTLAGNGRQLIRKVRNNGFPANRTEALRSIVLTVRMFSPNLVDIFVTQLLSEKKPTLCGYQKLSPLTTGSVKESEDLMWERSIAT